MPPILFKSIVALEENPSDVFTASVNVLIRVAGNVLKDPGNPKFRSISLASNVVATKLLPANGAMECLFEMGFQEGVDKLEMPSTSSLDVVKDMYDKLVQSRDHYNKNKTVIGNNCNEISSGTVQQPPQLPTTSSSPPSTSGSSGQPSQSQSRDSSVTSRLSTSNNKIFDELTAYEESISNAFLSKMVFDCKQVLRYENNSLKVKALQCIPMVELNLKVEKNIRKIQMMSKKKEMSESVVDYEELLLLELLAWFKTSFFTWVDTPQCDNCGSRATKLERLATVEGDRVEVYKCETCSGEISFRRYTDPEILLTTRKGRCGEWANCFTLLCRAIGWEARLVIDRTDHVWTEVYNTCKKSWVHCDPCENVMASPLIYEGGWAKKLSYILGYSRDGVQDVTWRYTSRPREVQTRREACTEQELVQAIAHVRDIMLADHSAVRKAFVIKRIALELVDLMKPQQIQKEDSRGRTSGSLAWRLARGETSVVPYLWQVHDVDLKEGCFKLEYNSSSDVYKVNGETKMQGWQSGVWVATNMQRTEEVDWKMTYIARTEGSEEGNVSWKIDFTGYMLEKVEITCDATLFHSASAHVSVAIDQSTFVLTNGNNVFNDKALWSEATNLKVTARLWGGQGDCSWQHSQLFREKMAGGLPGLSVCLYLKQK